MKIRYSVAALAVTSFVLGGAAAPGLAEVRPLNPAKVSTPPAALYAAGWLGRQFLASGDLPVSSGEAGLNNLSMALVALDSAEAGSDHARRGISYLEKHFTSYVSTSTGKTSVDLPGRLAQAILAAVAMHVSPIHFGGTSRANNLVARLLATQAKTGTDAGLFGSPASPTYSSAYTQGLALLALAAVGQPNKSGAQWLVAQQCANGGWTSYRSSLETACPAEDPATYAGADTNSTSMAVQALVATKVSPRVSPLKFLEASQYANGGFGYIGAVSGKQPVDPDSTALVIQALVALKQLSNPAFRRSATTTPEAALAHFQLGCKAPASERGAYGYPGISGPNLIATIQAIPAAARKAFPIGPAALSSKLPTMSCPSTR